MFLKSHFSNSNIKTATNFGSPFTGNYIAVLEVCERLASNQPTINVRVYSNWERCTTGSPVPVRARIAGQPPSDSSWDTLNPRQFELIELPVRGSPKSLGCCMLTGNVIVGQKSSLALFKFSVYNEGMFRSNYLIHGHSGVGCQFPSGHAGVGIILK